MASTVHEVDGKRTTRSSKSPRPSRNLRSEAVERKPTKKADYGSEGVTDNDILLLPGSDYSILAAVTIIAAAVRIFRIYQPTSVVFDEVQCVRSSQAFP